MTPAVAVITPARDASAYLEATYASLRAQTLTDWEWIVADDGSADGTAALVAAIGAADPRVRVVRVSAPNGLPARARNVAVAASSAPLLALLDADDRFLPEKLARQTSAIAADASLDGVACGFAYFGDDESAARAARMHRELPPGRCTREECFAGVPYQTSTLLLRRSAWESLGGMDEDPRLRGIEDSEFALRLVSRFAVLRSGEILAGYRVAPIRASHSGETLSATNDRGRRLIEVLAEKRLLTPGELRRKRGQVEYEAAKDSLFHLGAPFRGALLRSVATGRPPMKAIAMTLLCPLPAPWLRRLLLTLAGTPGRRLPHPTDATR